MTQSTASKHTAEMRNYSLDIKPADPSAPGYQAPLPHAAYISGALVRFYVAEASVGKSVIYLFSRDRTELLNSPKPTNTFSAWTDSTNPTSFYAYNASEQSVFCPPGGITQQQGGYCVSRVEIMEKGGVEPHPDGPLRHKLVLSAFERGGQLVGFKSDGWTLVDSFFAPKYNSDNNPLKHELFIGNSNKLDPADTERSKLSESTPTGIWSAAGSFYVQKHTDPAPISTTTKTSPPPSDKTTPSKTSPPPTKDTASSNQVGKH
jgi:hypothetical protein